MAAGTRQLKARNILFEFLDGNPRVLADVFSVGFVPEPSHEGRIKLAVEVVIASNLGLR
jgi:hypothetical protein